MTSGRSALSTGPMTIPDQLATEVAALSTLSGKFRLRSGQVSDRYFDKYLFEASPTVLRAIAVRMVGMMPAGVDAVAGLELGGIPLATMISSLTGLPTRFVRKKAKEYGTERLAEGGEIAGLRLVVVEDVITSAGQVITSCADLRALGADIALVLAVIDREAGGREALERAGLSMRSVFTRSDLETARPGG